MKKSVVHIDFDALGRIFQAHIRAKAREAGGSIVYMKDGKIVEETPVRAGDNKSVFRILW